MDNEMKKIFAHIYDWAELYVGIPLAILLLAGGISYIGTFQKPALDMGAISELGFLAIKMVFCIVGTTALISASGGWSKHNTIAGEYHDLCSTVLIFYGLVYLVSH